MDSSHDGIEYVFRQSPGQDREGDPDYGQYVNPGLEKTIIVQKLVEYDLEEEPNPIFRVWKPLSEHNLDRTAVQEEYLLTEGESVDRLVQAVNLRMSTGDYGSPFFGSDVQNLLDNVYDQAVSVESVQSRIGVLAN